MGQDGISYAPVNSRKELRAIRDQIAGWNGNPSDEECETTLAGIGLFEWKSVGDYLDCLERNRTATNVAMLVPQVGLPHVDDLTDSLTTVGEPPSFGLWAIRYTCNL